MSGPNAPALEMAGADCRLCLESTRVTVQEDSQHRAPKISQGGRLLRNYEFLAEVRHLQFLHARPFSPYISKGAPCAAFEDTLRSLIKVLAIGLDRMGRCGF